MTGVRFHAATASSSWRVRLREMDELVLIHIVLSTGAKVLAAEQVASRIAANSNLTTGEHQQQDIPADVGE